DSAGGIHHHRLNFNKYHPGYLGKLPKKKKRGTRTSAQMSTLINCELWSVNRHGYKHCQGQEELLLSSMRCIWATKYKVLSKGKIPKQPVIEKVKFFSRRAGKVKDVSRACVLVA
ncbi:hypothetical protein FD754_001129, partial [Muntiacus muntjak]